MSILRKTLYAAVAAVTAFAAAPAMAEYPEKPVSSDKAKKLSADTGALIYWQDAESSKVQIKSDEAAFGVVNGLIDE